jgi:hypothetical protein
MFENQTIEEERCMNPWREKCLNSDIALYIMYSDQRFPICQKCWKGISEMNFEWEYN